MRPPVRYQINTRVLLQERAATLGRPATLDDVPDALLDALPAQGMEWVWFLGVWQTGKARPAVSRNRKEIRQACAHCLPDLKDEDICGSPFAVQAYTVHKDFGGDAALGRLRQRLASRGVRLLLDFVPNHVAPDHPWVESHPEYFVPGNEADLARESQNYVRLATGKGERILAYGRDPYFSGWPDTLQLKYRHSGLRQAMLAQLSRIAGQCDGVRCDMAMLVQLEVFQRTWGYRALPSDGSSPVEQPFWPAAIRQVRQRHPQFLFIAEVY